MARRQPRFRVILPPTGRVTLDLPFPIEATPAGPPPQPTRPREPVRPGWDEPDEPIVAYLSVDDVSTLRVLGNRDLEQYVRARPQGHPIAVEIARASEIHYADVEAVLETAIEKRRDIVIRILADA